MTLKDANIGQEYIIQDIQTDDDELILTSGANEVALAMGLTKAAALAYLMFNLFTPPCFAALGAMNSEINDRKWFWGGVGLQFATGYTVALLYIK